MYEKCNLGRLARGNTEKAAERKISEKVNVTGESNGKSNHSFQLTPILDGSKSAI